MRVGTEQDLAGRRRLLQPGRDVDRIAGHEALAAGRVARDDLTGVDARTVQDHKAVVALELVVQARELLPHVGRCVHSTQRVVLLYLRKAEHGHDRIADELLDHAAVPIDDGAHRVEVARHHPPERLRVELFAECGRAYDVGEQNRDGLAHLCQVLSGCEDSAASRAEAGAGRVLFSAARAPQHTVSLGRDFQSAHRSRGEAKGPVSGAFPVAGAGFEPATSGL